MWTRQRRDLLNVPWDQYKKAAGLDGIENGLNLPEDILHAFLGDIRKLR